MHRRKKNHKLLNKQLIFETISNVKGTKNTYTRMDELQKNKELN